MRFTWRGREFGEKDIIILLLAAIAIFTISYSWHLENTFEEIDFELQLCECQQDPGCKLQDEIIQLEKTIYKKDFVEINAKET